jgi:tryptophan halogenase
VKINNVVILGGGTAGWLAANHLGKVLKNRKGVSVTVIESPDIPTIGVGEGTVPMMRETLRSFGISESEFIQQCDVTFKQSIKFVNWLDKTKHGADNHYHHLFDFPFPFGDDLSPLWLSGERTVSFGEHVSPQVEVCEKMLAPKTISMPEYEGATTYAYHLNAAKFALLLGRNAKDNFGVTHLKANVVNAKLDESGNISSIETDTYGDMKFDFYVDCTGFSAYLIEKHLKVKFIDKSKELFVDKAITVQVPTEENSVIPPYTVATAHKAGWIWDIALTERRGVGFVYSTRHMSDEEAKEKLNNYLGGKLNELTPRVIPMKVGYREVLWEKNCVALGLAQGFFEPIEATSILLTDFSAKFLAERFPTDTEEMADVRAFYNKVVNYSWERVVDFIKLHYCISDRTDSQFWIDNRDPNTISTHLKAQLKKWETFSPKSLDFFSKFEVFDVENFLYVLYGMKYPTQKAEFDSDYEKMAIAQLKQLKNHTHNLLETLPEHRELLNKIKLYGLSKV